MSEVTEVIDSPGPTRVLVVEHEAGCPPGMLGEALTAAGCELDVRRPYRGDPLPATTEAHDGLVVLGGTMDAFDDDVAWLAPVRALVVDAASRSTPTLGICLGHQLCAMALGGRVARNPRGQQVGLRDVGATPALAADPLLGRVSGGPDAGPAVFWNHDVVVEPPPGTVELARAATGELQAARFAATVWGVQWHPEADDVILAGWAFGDAERHGAAGVDQAGLLAAVTAARPHLDAAARTLATALLRLASPAVEGSRDGPQGALLGHRGSASRTEVEQRGTSVVETPGAPG